MRVSTYMGRAHAGPCCSARLRGGPWQEGGAVTRGPPNGRGPRMSGPHGRTTKERRANNCGDLLERGEKQSAPRLFERVLWLCSSRRWRGLALGPHLVAGSGLVVCWSLALPPYPVFAAASSCGFKSHRIGSTRAARGGKVHFLFGVFVCACVCLGPRL